MRNIYIWQSPEWPNFTWNEDAIIEPLMQVKHFQGQLIGMMTALGLEVQAATSLDMVTDDIIKSCEIEGMILNSQSVRSSVARHLGIPTEGLPESDHYTEGVVQIMIDAVQQSQKPLDAERLFGWHSAMFPTGRSGLYKITVGNWRQGEEPLQVVSGAMGNEVVHYEAPSSEVVPQMMDDFLSWVENQETAIDPILKAGIAHLWFVAIHPFDDGNGRLTRTITDMLMVRADGLSHRFYSMSKTICKNKKEYYAILEKTTVGNTDITEWLLWFLDTLLISIKDSIKTSEKTIRKMQFWQRHRNVPMNERQVKMVNMLWDGFEGNLTNARWAKITKTSSSTALRDIQELVSLGVLNVAESGGRSTHYILSI